VKFDTSTNFKSLATWPIMNIPILHPLDIFTLQELFFTPVTRR